MTNIIAYELMRVENLSVPSNSEKRTSLECRAHMDGVVSADKANLNNTVIIRGGMDEIVEQLVKKKIFSDKLPKFREYKFTTLAKPELTGHRLYSPVNPNTLIELYGKMRQEIFSTSGVKV